jgi:branched-chain amino acid transport system substrate-binding protein
VLVGGLTATAAGSRGDGVTPQTILLGATAPLSDPQSAAEIRGAAAYFRYVNARGGVNGRTIIYRVADDASDAAQAVQATQQLVEEDGVFAIVNALGTEQNLATRDALNVARVPHLFVGSGATAFGLDYRRYPWTIGFRPSYRAEGWIYGSYVARSRPGAKIAVLYQDDLFGTELLAGLEQSLVGSKAKVVAARPFDGQTAQMSSLKSSRATVLALFLGPGEAMTSDAVARRLGWRPLTFTSPPSSVEGALSIAFLKDPLDVAWRDDAAMKLYRTIMSKYASGANVKDVSHVYGMAVAYETVKVLKAAGKTPMRSAVLAQMRRLNDASNPFLLPGIAVKTSATDPYPIEQAVLQGWSKGRWKRVGGLWASGAG